MARSKLTEELCEAICQDLREGNTQQYAAQHNGITKQTYYNWLKRGEESKTQSGKYFDFFDAVKKAQEEGKKTLIQGIQEHGKKNWQALAWLLERMYPDEFGRTQRVDMNANVKSEVKGTVQIQTETRLQRLRRIEAEQNEGSSGDTAADLQSGTTD